MCNSVLVLQEHYTERHRGLRKTQATQRDTEKKEKRL